MFRSGKLWLLLTFLTVLVGCQPVDSVNPLYTEKQVVFDPALLGTWVEKDGVFEFFQSSENSYTVVFRDTSSPPEQMVMTGYLVNLEGRRFLDLVQKKWGSSPRTLHVRIDRAKNGVKATQPFLWLGDGGYLQFAPGNGDSKSTALDMELKIVHWFFRVTNDQSTLQLDYIDDDRLNKLLDQKNAQIAHILVASADKDDKPDTRQLLLTASTPELQKFVLDHINDDRIFTESTKFHRSEPAAPPK